MDQHGPKMSSKRPLASIFGRFWKGLGRILGGFGKVLEHFLKLFYVGTPALSREAPWSVSMRGGSPTLTRVKYAGVPNPISVLDHGYLWFE